MHHENTAPKKKFKPIRSGINRSLIAKNYRVGEIFLVKDCSSYYDLNKIDIAKE